MDDIGIRRGVVPTHKYLNLNFYSEVRFHPLGLNQWRWQRKLDFCHKPWLFLSWLSSLQVHIEIHWSASQPFCCPLHSSPFPWKCFQHGNDVSLTSVAVTRDSTCRENTGKWQCSQLKTARRSPGCLEKALRWCCGACYGHVQQCTSGQECTAEGHICLPRDLGWGVNTPVGTGT